MLLSYLNFLWHDQIYSRSKSPSNLISYDNSSFQTKTFKISELESVEK